MVNSGNLKPMNKRTKSEQREIAQKAGIKSGEVRRARKTLKEELLLILESGNTQNKISLALIKKAIKGDIKAFEVIRDTIGEKPVDRQEVKADVESMVKHNVSEAKIEKVLKKLDGLADE